MQDLITTLDAAAGPSREIDHRIEFHRAPRTGCMFPTEERWVKAATTEGWASARYTSSIDAALTLGRTPSARVTLLSDAMCAVAKRHALHARGLPDTADATFEICREIIIAALRCGLREAAA